MLSFERSVYVVPRHEVPLDAPAHRELRRGVRSWDAIKEEDFERLRACADRRMHQNDVKVKKTNLDTLSSPTGRQPLQRKPSFEGTRDDLTVPEVNAYGRAIRRYIDQQLREIFPQLPEKPSSKAVLGSVDAANDEKVVDARDPIKRLWYEPHFALPNQNEEEVVIEPLSPFAERSRAFPGPLAFHAPVGLPLLLQRIRANKIMSSPPFNPTTEMFVQQDPPMTDDERCTSSLIASTTYDGYRTLLPVLTPPPHDRILSQALYQKSTRNKERVALARSRNRTSSVDCNSRRDSAMTVATLADTLSQARLPKPLSREALSFGDVLLRAQK